jgi:hypothetical protein
MPVAMKTLLIGAHAKLETKWNKRNKEIEERNKVENKKMELLPPAWTFEQLKNKVNFVRLIMHRLLYALPVNEECDVREDIVNWMVTTLVPIEGIALFRHTVDEKAKACVRAKMQSVGQTVENILQRFTVGYTQQSASVILGGYVAHITLPLLSSLRWQV